MKASGILLVPVSSPWYRLENYDGAGVKPPGVRGRMFGSHLKAELQRMNPAVSVLQFIR